MEIGVGIFLLLVILWEIPVFRNLVYTNIYRFILLIVLEPREEEKS